MSACILHLSDTHFGTQQPRVMSALHALAEREKPHLAIWSGDITQRARSAQFQAAKAFLEQLPIPHHIVVPGNHDVPLFNLFQRIFNPYKNFVRVFGRDLEPSFETAELLVIGLNTTRRWRHIEGELSVKQINTVAERVKTTDPKKLKLVVVHQPLYTEKLIDYRHLLKRYQWAIEAWANAGVNAVLGGHIHRPHIHAIVEPSDADRPTLWSIHAGTAISTRIRGNFPNSVNLIRYACHSTSRWVAAKAERWDFSVAQGHFVQGECVNLQ